MCPNCNWATLYASCNTWDVCTRTPHGLALTRTHVPCGVLGPRLQRGTQHVMCFCLLTVGAMWLVKYCLESDTERCHDVLAGETRWCHIWRECVSSSEFSESVWNVCPLPYIVRNSPWPDHRIIVTWQDEKKQQLNFQGSDKPLEEKQPHCKNLNVILRDKWNHIVHTLNTNNHINGLPKE